MSSAAKPERIAKRENRIMIELRIGKLEISSSAWWTGAVISELSGARATPLPYNGTW